MWPASMQIFGAKESVFIRKQFNSGYTTSTKQRSFARFFSEVTRSSGNSNTYISTDLTCVFLIKIRGVSTRVTQKSLQHHRPFST